MSQRSTPRRARARGREAGDLDRLACSRARARGREVGDLDRRRNSRAEPSWPWVEAVTNLLEPWRRVTDPVCAGLEHLPRRGRALVVANHTVMGLFDTSVLGTEVWQRRGRLLRGLADRAHYALPGWRDVLTRLGCVIGTRENAIALLRRGEAVLVFPGGGREVMKRRGEKYRLLWGERTGFAHVAIAAQAPIIPLAMVGGEEFFDIVLDANHPLLVPARLALQRLAGRDELPPIVRGFAGTPLPRPERLYITFGEPISTRRWKGRADDPAACRELRDEVRSALEERIAFTLDERARDPKRHFVARLLGVRRPQTGSV